MTYAASTVLPISLALAAAAWAGGTERRRGRSPARYWTSCALAALVLVLLTVVFDSAMIAADLYRYDAVELLGPHVGLAPVEDLAWPVVAALLLPAIWTLWPEHKRAAEEIGE